MTNLEYLNSPRFRVRLRRAVRTYCRLYLGAILLALLICALVTILDSCGSSGDIGAGNVTNLYFNSSVSNAETSVQLISDDYQIQSIETQDDGNIVIVTLIRK